MPVSSVQIIRRLDSQSRLKMRVSQRFGGKREPLAKYRRQQRKISQFLGTGEQNSENYENNQIYEIESVISEFLFMVIYAPLSLV